MIHVERTGLALAVGVLLLSGCAGAPVSQGMMPSAVTQYAAAQNPVVSSETQTLSPREIGAVMAAQPEASYQLGPDDVIAVSVYMHPELSVPPGAGVQGGTNGAVIGGDGSTSLPLVGTVHLGGMTLDEAQDALTADYENDIRNPNVTLRLMQAQSLRYYLLGSFQSPGIKYPGHNLTLLDALALGGGVDTSQTDLYQSYIARGSAKLPVDLHALLVDGDLTQNIALNSGDVIFMPSAANEYAYVLGAVSQPGEVRFRAGDLTLLQALSGAGMNLESYTNARLGQVRVIRSHGSSANFYVIDVTKILNGQAASFTLQPGDVVFVPPTLVATWNQALQQIIPSLQTASESLSPFVSIRYLEKN